MIVTKVKQADVPQTWQVLDGRDQTVGRLATQVACFLLGKHRPHYVPYFDTGDHVVVFNCSHLRFTGRKWQQKHYYHHSGYAGGIKSISAANLFAKDPCEVLRRAVKGMLPKNKLQAKRLKKLKTYAGEQHPHVAQLKDTAAATTQENET